MNTKEFFDSEIERYLLISGTSTEDAMVVELKRAAENLPPEAPEEDLRHTFTKVLMEKQHLLKKPADGPVIESEHMAGVLETLQNYLIKHHWEYQTLPFGNDVILYQVPLFSSSLKVTI